MERPFRGTGGLVSTDCGTGFFFYLFSFIFKLRRLDFYRISAILRATYGKESNETN